MPADYSSMSTVVSSKYFIAAGINVVLMYSMFMWSLNHDTILSYYSSSPGNVKAEWFLVDETKGIRVNYILIYFY